MSVVPYDDNFDEKVEAGAEALLRYRRTPVEIWQAELPEARQEARSVLLAAMAVKGKS